MAVYWKKLFGDDRPEWSLRKQGDFYRLIKSPPFWFDKPSLLVAQWGDDELMLYREAKGSNYQYKDVKPFGLSLLVFRYGGHSALVSARDRFSEYLADCGLSTIDVRSSLAYGINPSYRSKFRSSLNDLLDFIESGNLRSR